jgi:hypothetical protein
MSCLVMSRMQQVLVALGLVYACAMPGLAQALDAREMEGSIADSPVDGSYKGNAQQIAATSDSCQPAREVALDVHAGRVRLPWTDRQIFDAKIADDGTFFASIIPTVRAEKYMTVNPTLEGRIGRDGLTADYGTRFCRYRLVATRSPDAQHLSERTDAPGSRR